MQRHWHFSCEMPFLWLRGCFAKWLLLDKDKENSSANNGQGKHPIQQLKKAKKTDCKAKKT